MLDWKNRYPIGIDIDHQNIYAVQLKKTRQGFAVRDLVHQELETEAEDVPGAGPSLVSTVKKIKKGKRFRGKRVVLHIPDRNISVIPIRFEKGRTETPEDAIVRESEKHLSFPVRDAVIDYLSMIPDPSGKANAFRATVIAAPRDLIARYLELMKQSGLTVEAVDFRVASLIRLHNHLFGEIRNPAILCNIGGIQSLLSIVTENNILAHRTVTWRLASLYEKIFANLEMVSRKENAVLLLKTHGLAHEDRDDASDGGDRDSDDSMEEMRRAIYQIVAPYIDELVYEFHKIISYVRSEAQHPVFEGIYMYGHAALIRNLDRYFENRLGIPASSINPLEKVALSDNGILSRMSEGAPFALALGLAMRKVTWL
ncbi:pilus assembly protein PilM [Thermodesulfobacteriota bacterium]